MPASSARSSSSDGRAVVPRSTERARFSRMRAVAASADGASRSTTVTRLPARRNACAIPAPMRPPPRTPTWAGAAELVACSSALPLQELGHPTHLLGALEELGLQLELDRGMRVGGREQRRLGVAGRERVVRRDAVRDRVRRRQQVVGGRAARRRAPTPAPRRRSGCARSAAARSLGRGRRSRAGARWRRPPR